LSGPAHRRVRTSCPRAPAAQRRDVIRADDRFFMAGTAAKTTDRRCVGVHVCYPLCAAICRVGSTWRSRRAAFGRKPTRMVGSDVVPHILASAGRILDGTLWRTAVDQ